MAKNRGQVSNLKPFVKGDPRIRHDAKSGIQYNTILTRALKYKTPPKLRAQILKETGQETITYAEAVMATLVANAAQGSAAHMNILFKLKGDYARAEAEALREVEHDNGDGTHGSTLLIKVVRHSDVTPVDPVTDAIDVTPENSDNAS